MRILFFLIVSMLFLNCSANTTKIDICVTKVIVDWKNISHNVRNSILNQAFNIEVNKKLADDIANNKSKNEILGEMGSLKNKEWLYFIYKPNLCEDRLKHTKQIMEKYFDPIQGAPNYIIIDSISKKEFNILMHQDLYNEKKEEEKWLNKETQEQVKRLKYKK